MKTKIKVVSVQRTSDPHCGGESSRVVTTAHCEPFGVITLNLPLSKSPAFNVDDVFMLTVEKPKSK